MEFVKNCKSKGIPNFEISISQSRRIGSFGVKSNESISCDECSPSTAHKSHLKTYQGTHTREKRYKRETRRERSATREKHDKREPRHERRAAREKRTSAALRQREKEGRRTRTSRFLPILPPIGNFLKILWE